MKIKIIIKFFQGLSLPLHSQAAARRHNRRRPASVEIATKRPRDDDSSNEPHHDVILQKVFFVLSISTVLQTAEDLNLKILFNFSFLLFDF